MYPADKRYANAFEVYSDRLNAPDLLGQTANRPEALQAN